MRDTFTHLLTVPLALITIVICVLKVIVDFIHFKYHVIRDICFSKQNIELSRHSSHNCMDFGEVKRKVMLSYSLFAQTLHKNITVTIDVTRDNCLPRGSLTVDCHHPIGDLGISQSLQ